MAPEARRRAWVLLGALTCSCSVVFSAGPSWKLHARITEARPQDARAEAAALVRQFVAATGGQRVRFAVRTLLGEGVGRTGGSQAVNRWWLVTIRGSGYQSGSWRQASEGKPGFVGAPAIYGVSGGSAWSVGTGFTLLRPYIAPNTLAPANPKETMDRREVLWPVLGILPDALAEEGLVSFTGALDTWCDGRRAVATEVGDRDGTFGRLYFDATTHLPMGYEYRIINAASQGEYRWDVRYRGHTTVDGVAVPMEITRTASDTPPGQGHTIRVTKWTVNASLDPALVRPNRSQPEALVPPRR